MPTPSDELTERSSVNDEWAARSVQPPRSVFGNYQASSRAGSGPAHLQSHLSHRTHATADSLQSSIDSALARSFVYRFLAQVYQHPTTEAWTRASEADCRNMLARAVGALAAPASSLAASGAAFCARLQPEEFEGFQGAYLAAFGHAARGRCPLNEIEYGDIKADPLFQPHRLADLVAFYRAFGLELAEDADERHDHICLELEFMCVLAAKEAYALEHQFDSESLSMCREAQKKFLREHLGRWTPAFTRRLARMAGDTPLGALANFTREFIEAECTRCGVPPGSEDLLLRPVDETAESLCNSCGVTQAQPGALPPSATTA